MGPVPAVASVRRAVRRALADLPSGALALVACSGGPDSLALAAAAAFEAPRSGRRAGAVTVDHGLQPGSSARAAALVHMLHDLGLEPVEALPVRVADGGGPEAAARYARYRALDAATTRLGAAAMLLGHTLDDQAETVLLGLGRGSGARSLAGMAVASGSYRRPLLGVDRATTRAACDAERLAPWDDPHNTDPSYTRARVRHDALPALERALGEGVTAALARSADLLRDDADALDAWTQRAMHEAVERAAEQAEGAWPGGPAGSRSAGSALSEGQPAAEGGSLDVGVLAELPAAVRRRVLRRVAVAAGCPAGALAAVHVLAAEDLVVSWRGQRGVDLPGGVSVRRRYGKLLFTPGQTS